MPKFPQPQYLGNKVKHLDWIKSLIPKSVPKGIVLDPFAGSHSVSYMFKQEGYKVICSDFLQSCSVIGHALIENDSEILDQDDIELLFKPLEQSPFIMRNFIDVFFNQNDAKMLDDFNFNIGWLKYGYKQSLALTVMCRAMTMHTPLGHFAHLKTMEYASNPARIKRNPSIAKPLKELFLKLLPEYNAAVFSNGNENLAWCANAEVIARMSKGLKPSLLYLDPPYCGSHANYQGFYHVLETFVSNYKGELRGKTKKYPRKYSGFDNKKEFMGNMRKLLNLCSDIPCWMISYNSRSYPSLDDWKTLISEFRNVGCHEKPYLNSVGGKGSVKDSSEIVFVCQ